MSVRIRLQRHGRKQTPIYHIVVADARSPRDGSFIERIGMYNPMTKPATIEIDRMKAYAWLNNGAQPTDTVRAILRFKGVLYYKHLQRGVVKNAMTSEDAELKFRAWVDEKEARIEARVKEVAAEKKEKATQISGSKRTAKKKEAERDDELLNVNLAESAAAETADQVIDQPADQTPTQPVDQTEFETAEQTESETVDQTNAEPAEQTEDQTASDATPESTAESTSESTEESTEEVSGETETEEQAESTADDTTEDESK